MGTGVSSPPPRDLGNELGQIGRTSGSIFNAENEQARTMGKDQLNLSGDFMSQAIHAYPTLTAEERAATSLQRADDVIDLGHYGPKFVDALNKINPDWQKSLDRVNAQAAAAGQASPLLGQLNTMARSGIDRAGQLAPSALRTELTAEAQQALAAGGNLTPEQARNASQAARAAYAARGINESNPALIGEVLARDQYSQQRLGAARAFAGQTQQLGQSEDESLIRQGLELGQLGAGVEGLNQQQQAQARGAALSAVQANQNALQPVLGFFGQRTDVAPTAGAQIMSSAPNIIGAGTQAMAPMMNYGQDLFNTNFNAQAAAKIASANNRSALTSGIISSVGSLVGAAAGACWVAREVFGREWCSAGRKWEVFRGWLVLRSPRWFYHLYMRHGEAFAEIVKRRPWIKRVLRPVMTRVVRNESRRLLVKH